MLTRSCTWENSPYRATAATAAIKSPVTTYSFLPVAQYSITKNTANSTSASPRSFSSTTTMKAKSHMTTMGIRVRRSGSQKGPTRQVNTDSSSRFRAR